MVVSASCSSHTEAETTGLAAATIITAAVPSDWVGHHLRLKAPTLKPIGKRTVIPGGMDRDPMSIGPVAAKSTAPAPGSDGLIRTMPDGTQHQLSISAQDLRTLGEFYHKNGLTGAHPGQPAPDVSKAWPNGIDNRAISHYGPNDWPRDTFGALLNNSGVAYCTATLFSSQLVMTAAHCVFSGDGTIFWPAGFYAGYDGGLEPYFSQTAVTAFSPYGYTNNHCYSTNSEVCAAYDYAFFQLSSQVGNQTGWLGYWYDSNDATVASWWMYNLGYPGCVEPQACGAPSGCMGNTMWGAVLGCGTTQSNIFNSSIGDGWNANFWNGCATSKGHSGGAMYSCTPCGNGPCIVGMSIAGACCSTDCAGNYYPSRALRITQAVADFMSSLQSMYP
jgi:hypothetical protein